jgi:TIR domain
LRKAHLEAIEVYFICAWYWVISMFSNCTKTFLRTIFSSHPPTSLDPTPPVLLARRTRHRTSESIFFVSRASPDAEIATHIAHILENAGKRVIIQNWDFKNRSFMERMQATHTSGGRVVALLRPTIRAVIAARRSGRTPSQMTHSTVKVWSLP